jgi:hypothetical protein
MFYVNPFETEWRGLDARNSLIHEFAIPPSVGSGSAKDHIIRRDEGWILGCSS